MEVIINHKPLDIEKIHTQMLYLGLVLNLAIPLGFLTVGLLLRKNGVGTIPIANLKLFFWVLFFISISELVAIFIFRRIFFAKFSKRSMTAVSQISIQKSILTFSIGIFALSLAPSICGLVYFLLGGRLEEFLLFIAITFLGFRIFRPNLEEIKQLSGSLTPA